MIEFMLNDRRLRLYPDGVIMCRAIMNGVETKTETWRTIKFTERHDGYFVCNITIDGILRLFLKHRIIKLAHNPSWDIFDSSKDNCVDHRNCDPRDNSNENLRVVTQQQNNFNRSDVKGYMWDKAAKKWRAHIKLNGKQIFIGRFIKEEDARAAYLKKKEELHIMPN